MTDQIDFRVFLVRAPKSAAAPGTFGTAALSGVSGFATSVEPAFPVVAPERLVERRRSSDVGQPY
jgi:hypothetical protein